LLTIQLIQTMPLICTLMERIMHINLS